MNPLRSFEEVVRECTCKKRVVVCEIFDKHGNVIARESNRCNPPLGRCARMEPGRTEYGDCEHSMCQWDHAERRALRSMHDLGAVGQTAKVYGHDHICVHCRTALGMNGIWYATTHAHPQCGRRGE